MSAKSEDDWLVHRIIEDEEILHLDIFYLDHDEPEVIYIALKNTDFIIKILKSFKNSVRIDVNTNKPLLNQGLVAEYDHSLIQINLSDPHLAVVRVDDESILVKRSFIGGVVDNIFDIKNFPRYKSNSSVFTFSQASARAEYDEIVSNTDFSVKDSEEQGISSERDY